MAKKAIAKKTVSRKIASITVAAKVSGGKLEYVEASTLGELKEILEVPKYQATVDGEPQSDDSFRLSNDSVVILTAPVKGA